MKLSEVMAAVEAEIQVFADTLVRLTPEEVRDIFAKEIVKYGPGKDALQGTRTEVSAALQARNPAPHTHDPESAQGRISLEQREAMHEASRASVSDAHRILSDHAKRLDPNHTDAHHFVQKLHGTAIWREVDRAIAEAGVRVSVGGVS